VGESALSYGLRVDQGGGVFTSLVSGAGDNDDNLDAPDGNDILMVAYDADAGKLWFGADGVWGDFGDTGVGDPAGGANEAHLIANPELYDFVPAVSVNAHSVSLANFGQHTYAHTPPTGFKALSLKNLPKPQFVEPNVGFDIRLYEGTGAELVISDLNFTPDFVWIKNREAGDSHTLFDTIRGASKYLCSEDPDVEVTNAQTLKSFDENGFTLGTSTKVNTNNEDYVAWCLKKSIEFGFDIVTFTGNGNNRTIAHSLGAVPEVILVKNLDTVSNWALYHHHGLNKGDPETDYGRFNATNAFSDTNTMWNDTKPTSEVFSVGTSMTVNENTKDIIVYLWRSVPGFSKTFSFEGNANAAGPYINCGFRPKWILMKNADGTDPWPIYDNARSLFNPMADFILADDFDAETDAGGHYVDFLANGFKIRSASTMHNDLNKTIVGIAFAEQPGKYANAR
jgi:hypothetical protein